jgi:hypothetical protein
VQAGGSKKQHNLCKKVPLKKGLPLHWHLCKRGTFEKGFAFAA